MRHLALLVGTIERLELNCCLAMSKLILEREPHPIRERLEAIEGALGEEMMAGDEKALEEALREHREGTTVAFKARRPRPRKR